MDVRAAPSLAEHYGRVPSGVDVSRVFFERAVRPIVEHTIPDVGYLAGRLGSGSDVLGFDDAMSVDHDFGCRLTVLFDDRHASFVPQLDEALSIRLPDEVDGWPVRFTTSWDDGFTHKVDLHTAFDFAQTRLGVDLRPSLDVPAWLCLTGQSVLEVIGGSVFHDTTDEFELIRGTLGWYPPDVWYYVLAAGWRRLAQELPLVGRSGHIGDEGGSAVIAARLCRDITHLTFMVERTWMPYPKWAGTALMRLPDGEKVVDQLEAILTAPTWVERQRHLAVAIEFLANRHRDAGIDLPVRVIVPVYARPFIGISDPTTDSLRDRITDPSTRNLPPIGSIEQWSDNVDMLTHPVRRAGARTLYAHG